MEQTVLDNRLAHMDHAGLAMERATGIRKLMQMLWVYDHPVDIDGVRRFHHNFGFGLAGRRIERSPLPFGRPRWVSSLGPPAPLEIAETPRPRSEVTDWADECAALPIDVETGPAWRMAVLPLTDGGTAVTLVGSHLLGDGIGAVLSVVETTYGVRRDIGYPPPYSRTRFRGALTDMRETARELPDTARTVAAAAKLGLRMRGEQPAAPTTATKAAPVGGDEIVTIPAVSLFVDLAEWDAAAAARNGNSHSLLAGFAARLGDRMGRRRPDGSVGLILALNDRASLEDTRAQAMKFAQADIDAGAVATDLSDARTVLREAVKIAREETDETLELLPLVPFVPRRALAKVAEAFFGSGDELPVSCSNLGDLDPAVGRVDGTDAEYTSLRGIDQGVRRAELERMGGQLVVVGGRLNGKVTICVVGYQCGAQNSKARLRDLALEALGEFGLTAETL
ncbi:Fatty acyl-AMP ligase FadD28 and polyketide synthase [Mycolicibacterium phlei]|jgi:hypothetical protein|uniref:Fatty acyl-AMP ligase FadD28 and polyketide synthase n=1 Tax=Mycolicibacterium phlei DSM 43239 = CCUG 21000 TaxID=1226750 RepID=A0A5N5VBE0_MYCPH|nr:hypothetical protein [Mycolicibacterium phlei]VEG07932.1 Fatty acyl-AMP ligase FadD28 and polyketide synthase [Mycobacteroides chelonae]AMO59805.1 hypothetical protein MPHLCCUG_00975 [Mycolicibacterium phlei]EID18260.1 hypothetical protein MPHLEI_01282 [Mycolicibacterium phlei RIVM601174]KAB7759263.1 hypothetical protein MPHL21000_03315 [Mycolicibacterium phlei DSM 43239 = CCUG 21000]KXW61106.1 hypothetical protein MPHL43070_07070 [Mycolicibacterium phlei DSM 43070]